MSHLAIDGIADTIARALTDPASRPARCDAMLSQFTRDLHLEIHVPDMVPALQDWRVVVPTDWLMPALRDRMRDLTARVDEERELRVWWSVDP
jgi:hypothetical protein